MIDSISPWIDIHDRWQNEDKLVKKKSFMIFWSRSWEAHLPSELSCILRLKAVSTYYFAKISYVVDRVQLGVH